MLITIFSVAPNLLLEDSLRTFNVNTGCTHGTLDTVVNVTSPFSIVHLPTQLFYYSSTDYSHLNNFTHNNKFLTYTIN